MNITEDYVSFETAKLLKEKGYKGSFNDYYNNAGCVVNRPNAFLKEPEYQYYKRVSLHMAMKWLREVYGLFVRITEDITGNVFEWSVYQKNYGCRVSTYIEDSYEQACETAIKYCLENLI